MYTTWSLTHVTFLLIVHSKSFLSRIQLQNALKLMFYMSYIRGRAYLIRASISFYRKIGEVCIFLMIVCLFFHLTTIRIKYQVYYTIILIDYLRVIHMTIPCHDFTASNLVGTITTLVMYPVLKPLAWVIQWTGLVIFYSKFNCLPLISLSSVKFWTFFLVTHFRHGHCACMVLCNA